VTLPRFIQQPGPTAPDRIVAIECRGQAFTFELEPGLLLLDAVRKGFAEAGFESGVLELKDVALTSFAYVMPALSKTPANAAFYSDIYRPEGVTHITYGAMTFGCRGGEPFFHCHAVWQEGGEKEAAGKVSGGHILPDGSIIAEPVRVTAFGLDGAAFEAVPDSEVNFTLFRPMTVEPNHTIKRTRAFAIRLRPNQDFTGAIEAFCANNNIHNARIRGGVGSTIGVHFEDGRMVDNFATEVFIRDGLVARGLDGMVQARVDVALVDYTGATNEGVLMRGHNPVLMTFELVLEVIS
jgi:predicted DNA-binding protein with PD1-like motif